MKLLNILIAFFLTSNGYSQNIYPIESFRYPPEDQRVYNLRKNFGYSFIDTTHLDTFNGCPPTGKTKSVRLRNLNTHKNRYDFPSESDLDLRVTLKELLKRGNDQKRWSMDHAAEITGYVFEVKPGGAETCNCKASTPGDIDTHIVLVQDPNKKTGKYKMIVEVTPRIRYIMSQRGIDWSTDALKKDYLHKWVRFSGWLFFDDEHKGQAENTAPGNKKNWRGTAWEIHPITGIEIANQ